MTNDTQQAINKIHCSATSIEDLLNLLEDQRGIVRANVLFELPNREISDDSGVVTALKEAATNELSNVKLMGNVTQRKFAIATLAWINGGSSKLAYDEMLDNCDEAEVEDIKYLVTQGPIST